MQCNPPQKEPRTPPSYLLTFQLQKSNQSTITRTYPPPLSLNQSACQCALFVLVTTTLARFRTEGNMQYVDEGLRMHAHHISQKPACEVQWPRISEAEPQRLWDGCVRCAGARNWGLWLWLRGGRASVFMMFFGNRSVGEWMGDGDVEGWCRGAKGRVGLGGEDVAWVA